MSETKLNQELIEQLQKCKTKEEVAKFAKENQLTDEELEKVAGGVSTMRTVKEKLCYVVLEEDE